MKALHPKIKLRSAARYILTGLITVAPLGITWLILDFLFGQLSRIGRPWVTGLARAISPKRPAVAAWLEHDAFLSIISIIVVLAFLWGLGWMATRVVGQRMIHLFEKMVGIIPFVDTIYQATKRLLTVAGHSSEGERRVVLIDFPLRDMKVVGLITRLLKSSDTRKDLAVVYVPTSPNPTSGFTVIVPINRVIFTDWTFDQAMAFIVTSGSSAPENMPLSRKRGRPESSIGDKSGTTGDEATC